MKVFCAIPVLEKVDVRFMSSFMAHCFGAQKYGIQVYLDFHHNDSFFVRIRNSQITRFIDSDCEHYFQVDSDIEFMDHPIEKNLFKGLIDHGEDFVGGMYAKTASGTEKTKLASVPLDTNSIDYDSGLLEMLWLAGGCWCLHRDLVMKMVDSYPDLRYKGDEGEPDVMYGLFNEEFHVREDGTKKFQSEDYIFCDRARAIGAQIWADTSILLGHWGWKCYTVWEIER